MNNANYREEHITSVKIHHRSALLINHSITTFLTPFPPSVITSKK